MGKSPNKFKFPEGTKTMPEEDIPDFVEATFRSELLRDEDARMVATKAIRTVLYALGYDFKWIDGRFRDILEAKYFLQREWYPSWHSIEHGDGWQAESPDGDVAVIRYREDTNDYFWEVLDSEGYSLDEGSKKTLDEAKFDSIGSLDLSFSRYKYRIKVLSEEQESVERELAIAKKSLADEMRGR